MLKFIDENDFLLVDSFQENEDGSVSWSWNDNGTLHMGIIREGMTRTDADGNEIDVWAALQTSGVQINPVNIDLLKDNAKQQINSIRDSYLTGGVLYNGHTYQTNQQSIMDLMGAIMAGLDTQWLTADNVVVPMTVAQLQGLGQAIAAHKEFYVYAARLHKDAIDALTTKAEIDAYMGALSWS